MQRRRKGPGGGHEMTTSGGGFHDLDATRQESLFSYQHLSIHDLGGRNDRRMPSLQFLLVSKFAKGHKTAKAIEGTT